MEIPTFWPVFSTLYFTVCIFIGIIGFVAITRSRGTTNPDEVWKHEDQIQEEEEKKNR